MRVDLRGGEAFLAGQKANFAHDCVGCSAKVLWEPTRLLKEEADHEVGVTCADTHGLCSQVSQFSHRFSAVIQFAAEFYKMLFDLAKNRVNLFNFDTLECRQAQSCKVTDSLHFETKKGGLGMFLLLQREHRPLA